MILITLKSFETMKKVFRVCATFARNIADNGTDVMLKYLETPYLECWPRVLCSASLLLIFTRLPVWSLFVSHWLEVGLLCNARLLAPNLRGDNRITRYVVITRQPGQGWGTVSVVFVAWTHQRILSKLNIFSPGNKVIRSVILSASVYTTGSGTVSSRGSVALTLTLLSTSDVNSTFTQFSTVSLNGIGGIPGNFKSAVKEFATVLLDDKEILERKSHSNKHSLKLQTWVSRNKSKKFWKS